MAEDVNSRPNSASAHEYVCSYPDCNKFFSKPSRLVQHMRTHTGEASISQ